MLSSILPEHSVMGLSCFEDSATFHFKDDPRGDRPDSLPVD